MAAQLILALSQYSSRFFWHSHAGMLPVLNQVCVDQAIKTGFGLNAVIHPFPFLTEKTIFMPIYLWLSNSQFSQPIVGNGYLDIDLENGISKRIGVTRLHLEMDCRKSIHDLHPTKTYIDLNRAGIALMEIVSEPDIVPQQKPWPM